MTDRDRYRALTDEVVELYLHGRHPEGVALVRAAMPQLPAWRADLAHLAACLLAVSGRPDEALAELRTAFDVGGWWHRRILVDDEDLASVQELDGFAELVEESHARAVRASTEPRPPVLRRPAGPPIGVLVALHGAGQDADDAMQQWQAAVDAGYVLVAIESSQRHTPTYRSWPDPAVGTRDITAAFATLPSDVQRLPLVVAGFSAGARQAMRWALAGWPGEPGRFIAVGPAIGPDHVDHRIAAAAAQRGLTGHVLLGATDDDVREEALAAVDELRSAGVAPQLELVPGLGHAFPIDFDDRLRSMLAAGVPTVA
ncbi:hypothetical protein SAMN05444365_101324 [Micromonospora pattaloongensis]|uniref:BCE-2095-like N-terminal domain-containing protein n=1 Tax=Micromonospora pattaloongensis TaxID=405436 RepID=A0A1H3G967_9ACTN|nr:hypothetical protein [Micromonospora pattaloongensis]SDX99605.1 hypothetical protein SAMN05444365_101324 [Micromonospora pattaloongensis]